MANWISSKLKAAENILQQIDQQAADSLRKNEKFPADERVDFDNPAKSAGGGGGGGGGSVSVKDQLYKKPQEPSNAFSGKSRSDQNINIVGSSFSNSQKESYSMPKEAVSSPKKLSLKPKATLTDSDWTQLLSTPPSSTGSASSTASRGGGVSGIRGLRKESRRQGVAGHAPRNQKGSDSVPKPIGKQGNKANGKGGHGVESGFLDSTRKSLEVESKRSEGNEGPFESVDDKSAPKVEEVSKEVDGLDPVGRSSLKERLEARDVASRSSTSDDLKRGSSSVSYESSDSDSGSSSDSEDERSREERRRRREKMLAEKAAAKAVEAIKEKENLVARLEGEKESLQKILEEQTKQQVQEASKLQTSMMETMEAVDLEKQKHNSTRMEVLARLAKLETANADLARSLATMQWNLEVEVNRVTELRQQLDLKASNIEELRRKISNSQHPGTSLKKSKGGKIEQEILEAEYAVLMDNVRKLQDKAKKLETDTEITRKEIEVPTEVEVELKRRLNQMTDHLIQKQAQVESLASEKATLQFRIEAISRMLEENKSMADFAGTSSRDLESGSWDLSDSKFKPLIREKIRSSQKHLYSVVQQVDSIFLAGAMFLRRNPMAKLWSLVYLVCLHFWVIYILTSHSVPSNDSTSGAVFSLENINNTSNM